MTTTTAERRPNQVDVLELQMELDGASKELLAARDRLLEAVGKVVEMADHGFDGNPIHRFSLAVVGAAEGIAADLSGTGGSQLDLDVVRRDTLDLLDLIDVAKVNPNASEEV